MLKKIISAMLLISGFASAAAENSQELPLELKNWSVELLTEDHKPVYRFPSVENSAEELRFCKRDYYNKENEHCAYYYYLSYYKEATEKWQQTWGVRGAFGGWEKRIGSYVAGSGADNSYTYVCEDNRKKLKGRILEKIADPTLSESIRTEIRNVVTYVDRVLKLKWENELPEELKNWKVTLCPGDRVFYRFCSAEEELEFYKYDNSPEEVGCEISFRQKMSPESWWRCEWNPPGRGPSFGITKKNRYTPYANSQEVEKWILKKTTDETIPAPVRAEIGNVLAYLQKIIAEGALPYVTPKYTQSE